uniref:Uncharacterized protein n=1 Tax=Oryza glumipatula TaxID=40148 RepID=A0A0D9Z439_9ORYZ
MLGLVATGITGSALAQAALTKAAKPIKLGLLPLPSGEGERRRRRGQRRRGGSGRGLLAARDEPRSAPGMGAEAGSGGGRGAEASSRRRVRDQRRQPGGAEAGAGGGRGAEDGNGDGCERWAGEERTPTGGGRGKRLFRGCVAVRHLPIPDAGDEHVGLRRRRRQEALPRGVVLVAVVPLLDTGGGAHGERELLLRRRLLVVVGLLRVLLLGALRVVDCRHEPRATGRPRATGLRLRRCRLASRLRPLLASSSSTRAIRKPCCSHVTDDEHELILSELHTHPRHAFLLWSLGVGRRESEGMT